MADPRTVEFRPVRNPDREPLLAIAAQTWEGHDYLPIVFDRWVADPRGYFAGAFLDGRIVGCGRALRLDRRRCWLEGLRVDPGFQGRGIGREVSRHVVLRALEMGCEELYFATYFKNHASVKVSESFGFKRIATFTNLELDPLPPDFATDSIVEDPGLPAFEGFLVNDWFFAPPGVERPEEFFPEVATIVRRDCRLVLSNNAKYPGWMEISGLQATTATIPPDCLRDAVNAAVRRGKHAIHLMLPERFVLAPFADAGFKFHERERDVWVYQARADGLRIPRSSECAGME